MNDPQETPERDEPLQSLRATSPLLETKEYRRFAECCDACRQYRYIGLCYGPPGVGKTLSACHYARWDAAGPVFQTAWGSEPQPAFPGIRDCRTLFYTVSMTTTPKQLDHAVSTLRKGLNLTIATTHHPGKERRDALGTYLSQPEMTELLVVDEADRLKFPALEQLRDLYDTYGFGLVLLGMPGIEKRLARYAQLYSRVGFVHHFRPLSADELRFILEQKWRELGLAIDLTDFDDVEAMSTILRITGGNFRLLQRLFAQSARIMAIKHLTRLTDDVIEAARESLVIGVT
jgi:DNA transposition AAA+ family ATPase